MDGKRQAILAEIPRLRRYARALLRDIDAADDLVQDCLERALARIDNWQSGESPRRWLFTLMYHLFVDETRRVKRRNQALPAAAPVGEAATAPEQATVLDLHDVLDALQELSHERRAAIVLVAVEGMSYAEAAAILDVPTGTLMSRVARGRAELRSILDSVARRKTIRVVEK